MIEADADPEIGMVIELRCRTFRARPASFGGALRHGPRLRPGLPPDLPTADGYSLPHCAQAGPSTPPRRMAETAPNGMKGKPMEHYARQGEVLILKLADDAKLPNWPALAMEGGNRSWPQRDGPPPCHRAARCGASLPSRTAAR